MNLIEMNGIRKAFVRGKDVLRGISLSVREGEVLSIIGSSGSGKSTLLRCATGLEQIDCGTIRICGSCLADGGGGGASVYVPVKERREILRNVGLVFQSFNLFPHRTVLQNVMDAPVRVLKQPKEAARATAEALLDKVNLADRANAYPCELSGGQQQRVAIARALALEPKVLFFDEPTSALDPELTTEVLRVIRGLKEMGKTMVIVTHEMAFARNVSDRVIYMREGVISAEGTPEEVFENSGNEHLARFLHGGAEI